MMKLLKKGISLALCAVMMLSLAACGSKGNQKSDGKLTFQIWDVAQKEGMEQMAQAYMDEHEDVSIEVQVTSWDEYWTKLEAAATSNTMPDIFWMHTNEILKYADNGILAETTDLVESDKFSDISLNNASGSDGKLYGVPKDKDTVCLVYNKEMFDAAGVSYPDDTWTWDDLTSASEKINAATGKYGYMAYADDQLGYWNFVYQNGGYILNEDKTEAGFTQPATKDAMKFYIELQENEWCPDQTYFAETAPGTAFFSQEGAMFLEGSWNLLPSMENNPEMAGKWDVAVLPKSPSPVSGDGRATISNGLCYATAAEGKNLDIAKDFLKFLGSEEAQKIQGESGAAIPAYEGLESTWLTSFDKYDYKLNAQVCLDMFDYSIQSVNNASRPEWKLKVNDELLKIYSGEDSFDDGIQIMQDTVDEASGK